MKAEERLGIRVVVVHDHEGWAGIGYVECDRSLERGDVQLSLNAWEVKASRTWTMFGCFSDDQASTGPKAAGFISR